jgi:hypothetical protein
MAGRPTKEPGGKMDIPLRIMLTAEQDRLIREQAAREGTDVSTWARPILLEAATTTVYLKDYDLTKAQASRFKDTLKALGAILYATECACDDGSGRTHFMATSAPVDRELIEIMCPKDKAAEVERLCRALKFQWTKEKPPRSAPARMEIDVKN